MLLIVGLGNPGPKYAMNRHNIGFMAVDQIAADHGFSGWKSRFQGQINEGRLGAEKVILLKPETFMNRSGQSVGEAMRFYKLTPEDVIVVHDEIDLAPGKVRYKQGGGHAGHNGLRSVHGHIGDTYARVRLGVGHPGHKDAVPGYVLRDFPKADQGWLDDVIRGLSDGAPYLAEGESGKFLNAVALRAAPPRSGTGTKSGASKSTRSGKTAPSPKTATPADKASPERAPEPEPTPRSAMQKLMDKFR